MRETLKSLRAEKELIRGELENAYWVVTSQLVRLLDYERFRKEFVTDVLSRIVEVFQNEIGDLLKNSESFVDLRIKLRLEIHDELRDELRDELLEEIRDELIDTLKLNRS